MPAKLFFQGKPVLRTFLQGGQLAAVNGFPQVKVGGGATDALLAPVGQLRCDNAERLQNTGSSFPDGDLSAESFSVLCTFSPDTLGVLHGLWGTQFGATAQDRVTVYLDTDDVFKVDVFSDDGLSSNTVSSGVTAVSGAWYQVIVTKDTTTAIRIYVNGVEGGSLTSGIVTQTLSTRNQRYVIFADAAPANSCQGRGGQNAVWDAVLTADEVKSLFNHGDWECLDLSDDFDAYVSSADLIRWYAPVDEPSNEGANLIKNRVETGDASEKLTLANIVASSIHEEGSWGATSPAYITFDGSTEYYASADDIDPGFSNEVTVEAWARLATTGAGDKYVVDIQDDTTTNVDRVSLRKTSGGPWGADFAETGATQVSLAGGENARAGEWVHLVATFSGASLSDQVKLFVNGEKVAENLAHGVDLSTNSNRRVRVAADADGAASSFLDGDIRLVRLWSRELTEAEALVLYFEGYSQINPRITQEGLDSAGLVHDWRLGQPALSTEQGDDTVADMVASGGLDITVNAAGIDRSNLGISGDGPKGAAYNFDGSTDYIGDDADQDLGFGQDWTIGAWVRPVNIPTSSAVLQTILEIKNSGNDVNRIKLTVDNNSTTPGRVRGQVWDSSGVLRQDRLFGNWISATTGGSGQVLTDGDWHFVVWRMRLSGTQIIECAVDGDTSISETLNVNGDAVMTNTNRGIRVGDSFAGSEEFEGDIGPVYIWATDFDTLTDEQVVEVARTRAFNPTLQQGDYQDGPANLVHWWTPGANGDDSIPDRASPSNPIDLSTNTGASVSNERNARVVTPVVPFHA